MKRLIRWLRYLELAAKYGARVAKRILHFEELLEHLQSIKRAAEEMADVLRRAMKRLEPAAEEYRKLQEKEGRLLGKAREAEEKVQDTEKRIERLKRGLDEGGPFPDLLESR